MLTREQIAFYEANGYLMVESALTAEQLKLLQDVTQRFIEQSRAVAQNNDVFELDTGHTREAPRLTRIKLPHLQHPAFRDLLNSQMMRSILTCLLGPDVRLNTSKLNTKSAGGGAAVEWHQDWAFYPHTNDDLLAVGIMLNDVDLDNGPLLVIPGSHRNTVLSHLTKGVFSGAISPDDPAFDSSTAVALTGKAGSISIHHVRTLHGSAPNSSDRARMLLFYECGAADAWPITGIISALNGMDQQEIWKTLNERMICGEQTIYPRLEKVPVTMPLPPAPDSSSIFRIQHTAGVRSAFKGNDRA